MSSHIRTLALSSPILQDEMLGLLLLVALDASQPIPQSLAYPLNFSICSSKMPCHHAIAVCVSLHPTKVNSWSLAEKM